MLGDYLADKCQVLAVGYEDTILDSLFLEELCQADLVYTKSVILEIPIALPCREDLSSGLSYWILEGKQKGVTLESAKEKYRASTTCNVHYGDVEDDTVRYMVHYCFQYPTTLNFLFWSESLRANHYQEHGKCDMSIRDKSPLFLS